MSEDILVGLHSISDISHLAVMGFMSGAETSFEQRQSYLEWNFSRPEACWLPEAEYLESIAYNIILILHKNVPGFTGRI